MNKGPVFFRWDRWKNGWYMGCFPAFEDLGIAHAVTTRQGPDVQQVASCTLESALPVAQQLNLEAVAFANQVHGAEVRVVDQAGTAGDADALCTCEPGLALVGKSADCPLILLADPAQSAIGFAHASWRSTVAGIVTALVGRMVQTLGCRPERMVAGICPSAGPECYEVGPEVYEKALCHLGSKAQVFFQSKPPKFHFDLWAANTVALVRCGFDKERIFISSICTLCRNDLLPSYRREGASAGRFMAIIGLPKPQKKMLKNR